jgi:hypothetical protein
MLAVRLQELALNHAIFDETAFTDEAMDKLASLGSQRFQKIHGLYKETRNNSMRLCHCINDIEQSAPMAVQNPGVPLPNSGSAAPSPPIVHMSQTDGVSEVVQGLWQTTIPLSWVPIGGTIKVRSHLLPIMVLMGQRVQVLVEGLRGCVLGGNMDKKTCNIGQSYQIMRRLWGWSLMTIGGNDWCIHRSYIVHLMHQERS